MPQQIKPGAAASFGQRWRGCRWLVLWFALALPAQSHPIHTSRAEADYNSGTGTLKVALRVFVDDFEAALSARAQRTISVATTPPAEFEVLARAYLHEHFTVKTSGGTRVSLQWLGQELKVRENELWLFFAVPLPDGVEGTSIHHAMLRDQFSNQINSVIIRDGSRRTSLVFLPSHREKKVRFRPAD